jgi:hypothetical protein
MNNLLTKLTSTAAATVALSVALALDAPKTNAASYNLSWEGNDGYTAEGMFSFDDQFLGQIITKNELSDFMISFFNPDTTLLASFDYDFPNPDTSGEFNFNFDSATGTIFQTGSFDTPMGFDLGIDFFANELGVDFYTSNGDTGFPPVGTIVLDESLSPQGCLTFPSPNCTRFDTGGELVATEKIVPEPSSMLGLLALGFLGAISAFKRK